MSCFIVSPQSIADLSNCINQVCRFGVCFFSSDLAWKIGSVFSSKVGLDTSSEIGKKLYQLNVDAYNTRYGLLSEDVSGEFENYIGGYSAKIPNIQQFELKDWIYIYKKLQCFLYQCNEFQTKTPIQDVLEDVSNALANLIAQKLDEYKQISWN